MCLSQRNLRTMVLGRIVKASLNDAFLEVGHYSRLPCSRYAEEETDGHMAASEVVYLSDFGQDPRPKTLQEIDEVIHDVFVIELFSC